MKQITKDPKTGRVRVQTKNVLPTKTKQEYADQVDVNKIIAKYKKTQDPSLLAGKTGVYADLTEIKDYQTHLSSVIKADEAFMALPSLIREKFSNDPSKLISFLADPSQKDESIRLGLRVQPKDWVDPNVLNRDKGPDPDKK